jgi:hypothetical protein
LGLGTRGSGEDIKKGCRRVNIVEYYVVVYENGKMRPGMGGGGIRENNGGANSTMIYCKNFCKCHNVCAVQQ